jgi:anaerobic ribonucleoside-triphosphate reductase activating protein
MSRDTWDPTGGRAVPIDRIVEMWRRARAEGATGLTISGGEPSQQADQVAELLERIRAESAESAESAEHDVLLFTGLDDEELRTVAPRLFGCVDALVLGRFDVTRPTDLIWRGSANQVLKPLTELGYQRYAAYLELEVETPEMQFAVDDRRIWTIGVPRIGDLTALEKQLRANGIHPGEVSWRP